MNSNFPSLIANYLTPRVGRTAKFIGIAVKAEFCENNIELTKEQFIVLLCLEGEPKSQSSLAFITERDKGSLTRLIQSLEKKAYVNRKNDKQDSRVNLVEITSKGKAILESTKPIIQSLFNRLQDGIKEEEIKIAKTVLERVQVNAQKELEKIEAKQT